MEQIFADRSSSGTKKGEEGEGETTDPKPVDLMGDDLAVSDDETSKSDGVEHDVRVSDVQEEDHVMGEN